MDIAGAMVNSDEAVAYLGKGMTGRPVRTLVELMKTVAAE
jgi:leucyl aminopeptidase